MSTHPTPSSSRASPAFVAGFVTPASGVPSSACSTPMERRLTAQVTRQDSKLRQINDELEDRTRLLERARVSVETLQADLARAQTARTKVAVSRANASKPTPFASQNSSASSPPPEVTTAPATTRPTPSASASPPSRSSSTSAPTTSSDSRANCATRLHRRVPPRQRRRSREVHRRSPRAPPRRRICRRGRRHSRGERRGRRRDAQRHDPRPRAGAPLPRYEKTDSETTSPRRDALEEAARRHEVSVAASEETMRRVRRGLEAHDAADVAGSVSGGLGERLAGCTPGSGVGGTERRMMARRRRWRRRWKRSARRRRRNANGGSRRRRPRAPPRRNCGKNCGRRTMRRRGSRRKGARAAAPSSHGGPAAGGGE